MPPPIIERVNGWWPIIAFLGTQLVGAIIFGASVNTRVSVLETLGPENRSRIDALQNRIDTIDNHGTRALDTINNRQQDVLRRLDALDNRQNIQADRNTQLGTRLDRLERLINGKSPP